QGRLAHGHFFLLLCSGLPLRPVWAIFSSSFSLIDETIELDAPLSLLLGVSPRLADSAAPAAFCWAADFAGMVASSTGADETLQLAERFVVGQLYRRVLAKCLCGGVARLPQPANPRQRRGAE